MSAFPSLPFPCLALPCSRPHGAGEGLGLSKDLCRGLTAAGGSRLSQKTQVIDENVTFIRLEVSSRT